jgi:hypothetical protein
MNIKVVSPSGELTALCYHLENEGDNVTTTDEGLGAELSEVVGDRKGNHIKSYHGIDIPMVVLPYRRSHRTDGPSWGLSRRMFNGQWDPQVVWSTQVVGLLDDNGGPQVAVGCGTRFVDDSKLRTLFEIDELSGAIEGLGHSGFVSLIFDPTGVRRVVTGIPGYGFYNVLEGARCKISDVLTRPVWLLESWTVGLLVSKFPWPHQDKISRYTIDTISTKIESHAHFFGVSLARKSLVSTSGRVAYVTAWSRFLEDAATRAIRTVRNIRVDGHQYRLDAGGEIRSSWMEFEQSEIDPSNFLVDNLPVVVGTDDLPAA